MPVGAHVEVKPPQRRELEKIVSASTSAQRDVFRAKIILALGESQTHEQIAEEFSTSLQTVSR